MQELKAGVTDAAVEKHVPVYTIEGSHVHVVFGETKHPMIEEHFIEWITLNTNQGIYRKQLNPGQEPVADFCLCDGEQVGCFGKGRAVFQTELEGFTESCDNSKDPI